jgi:hypothetical protein
MHPSLFRTGPDPQLMNSPLATVPKLLPGTTKHHERIVVLTECAQ